MKIDKKYAKLLFVFLTSLFMSLLMSGIVTIANLGIHKGFLGHWGRAWFFSFSVGFPVVSFVVPIAQKIVAKLTAN